MAIQVLAGLEAIEIIGVAVGVLDLSLNLVESEDASGIPTNEPYARISDFAVGPDKVVVGDRILASGVMHVGLGHLLDRTPLLGFFDGATSANHAVVRLTLTSTGGINVKKTMEVRAFPSTPEKPPAAPGMWLNAMGVLRPYEGPHVVGEGPGGYIRQKAEEPIVIDEWQKVCDEGTPTLLMAFDFELEGIDVQNETIQVKLEVEGYSADAWGDTKRTVEFESQPMPVEVNLPFNVNRTVDRAFVSHGQRAVAQMEIENLSFEKKISWSRSQLDGDRRRSADLDPRNTGNNKRTTNRMIKGHHEEPTEIRRHHPCNGTGEVWVERAIRFYPWKYDQIQMQLSIGRTWQRDSQYPRVKSVACVRTCEAGDTGIAPGDGEFRDRDGRTYWVPVSQYSDPGGDGQDHESLEPEESQSAGLRVRVRRQFNGPRFAPRAFLEKETGERLFLHDVGHHEFVLDTIPPDFRSGATLNVEAPEYLPVNYAGVMPDSDLEVFMAPDVVAVSGDIEGPVDDLQRFVIALFEPKARESDQLIHVMTPDREGGFRMAGLVRGRKYRLVAVPDQAAEPWTVGEREFIAESALFLRLAAKRDKRREPASFLTSGRVEKREVDAAVGTLVEVLDPSCEVAGYGEITPDGRFEVDHPGMPIVRVRLTTPEGRTHTSPPIRLGDRALKQGRLAIEPD